MPKRFPIDDTSTPVLLLRAVKHGGLCMMRSLGSAGVAVYVADTDLGSPAAKSRYCRGVFYVDPEGETEETLRQLRLAAKQIGRRPLLLPTTDVAATFVANFAKELERDFLFATPHAETAYALSKKNLMNRLAEDAGIPIPKTQIPASLEELRAIAPRLTYPVMLKSSEGHLLGREHLRKSMLVARSPQELIDYYELTDDDTRGSVMVQEYIAGGDDTVWMFDGFFDRGECKFGITGKKIRQAPVYTGATSLGICLKNETVDRQARQFMRHVQYSGPVDMGFRYDARDGCYKVLDVNPRIGATFRLFVDEADLDLARVIYLSVTGQEFAQQDAKWGRKWMVENNDLVSSWRYYSDGKLGFWQWLTSFRGVQEVVYISLRDWKPWFVMMKRDLQELGRRLRHHPPQTEIQRQPQPLDSPANSPDPQRAAS